MPYKNKNDQQLWRLRNKQTRPELAPERLRELIHYDPETGLFTSLKTRGRATKGKVLGTLRDDGYLHICIDGKWYRAHRLAWFYVYGEWPSGLLDHADRNPLNNALGNLRTATPTQNNWNKNLSKRNSSGTKGVYQDHNRWVAEIYVDNRKLSVGRYDTLEDASRARAEAAAAHFGVFVNPDSP